MNTPANPEVIEHLNDLRQLDYDAIQTYEQAIKHCQDDVDVMMDLMTFKLDHERHIVELDVAIANHGGAPSELHRDLKGALLEGMTRLRSVSGTLGALKAMRTVERLTASRYEAAVERASDRPILLVITAALDDEHRHVVAIEQHIERLERAERELEARETPTVPNVRL